MYYTTGDMSEFQKIRCLYKLPIWLLLSYVSFKEHGRENSKEVKGKDKDKANLKLDKLRLITRLWKIE